MRSLAARLGAGLVLSLLAAFVGLGLMADTALRRTAEGYILTRLEHDAESLLGAVQARARPPRLDPAAVGAIYRRPFSGHYFVVSGGGVAIRSRSLWDFTPAWPQAAPGEVRVGHVQGPRGQPLLLRVAGYRVAGRVFSVAVAEDLTALHAGLARNRLRLAAAGAVALVLLVAVQLLLLRRGLRPLVRLRAQIPELERGGRERLEGPVPAEVAPLVEEFNRLLALLARRLRRSRDAAGDLGHEIKRPLTLLRQLVAEAGDALPEETHRRMAHQLHRMETLVERMLARARLAGEGPPAAQFDAGRDLDDLLDTLRRMHAERGLHFRVEAPAGVLPVDREDMLELLGNLLDNACKWARTTVALTLRADGELVIEVEDDGPGLGGDAVSTGALARRGRRLDESAPGHGLGLAIVDTIVEQYGGRWEADASPALGGARVRVVLPQ